MSIKVPKNERYSKLALNVGDLGKIIVAKGFLKVTQSAKNAQSGHSELVTSHLIFDIKNYKLWSHKWLFMIFKMIIYDTTNN